MCKLGKKVWIIPDCYLPYPGEGVAKGHESIIILNDNDVDAGISVKLFFEDKDAYEGIQWTVKAGRVFCFRLDNLEHTGGYKIPYETQYALKITSDCNVVVQYGRLDNTQTNLAFYTTLGYTE